VLESRQPRSYAIKYRIATGWPCFSVLRRRRRGPGDTVGAQHFLRAPPRLEVYSRFIGTECMALCMAFSAPPNNDPSQDRSQSVLEQTGNMPGFGGVALVTPRTIDIDAVI